MTELEKLQAFVRSMGGNLEMAASGDLPMPDAKLMAQRCYDACEGKYQPGFIEWISKPQNHANASTPTA